MQRLWTWVLLSLAILIFVVGQFADVAIAQTGDYISGRVVSDGGVAEAGVWVIAEAKDVMQNDAHLADFRNRPWWSWAYNILLPVYTEMEELPGFAELPERFLKCIRLVLGSYGEHEVYTELYWDQNESRESVNRMLKKVGLDMRLMWKACCEGLRTKSCPALPV